MAKFQKFDPFTVSHEELLDALDRRMKRLSKAARAAFQQRLDYINQNRTNPNPHIKLNIDALAKTIMVDPLSTREGYLKHEREVLKPLRDAFEAAGADSDEARKAAQYVVRNTDIWDSSYFKYASGGETTAAREAKERIDSGTMTESDASLVLEYVKNFRSLEAQYEQGKAASRCAYRASGGGRAHNTKRK